MNSEMRKKLEEMAEKWSQSMPGAPVNRREAAAYLSGAEAGFKLGLEAAAKVAGGWDDEYGFAELAEGILALGED